MTGIAAWLLALVGPLAVRVMIGLAMVAVTLTGITEMVASLIAIAQSNWAAMPSAVLGLAGLSGIPEVLGLIMGAYASRMAIWVLASSTRFMVRAA